ncbi:MAG: YggT family protein [Peptococcaceae bacterium]|jgi:hypothetical protein|nr:YggT family protein [Peptococcaceae bacterium]MDH7523850.1 YggT family protein [Peptococcaceae bacterium]
MEKANESCQLAKKAIYYVLGLMETLLLFRFVFKLLGANPASGFVSFVYSLAGIFLAPFYGIFRPVVTKGLEVRSVFEPATLIAMIVYPVIAYGIVRLLDLRMTGTRE